MNHLHNVRLLAPTMPQDIRDREFDDELVGREGGGRPKFASLPSNHDVVWIVTMISASAGAIIVIRAAVSPLPWPFTAVLFASADQEISPVLSRCGAAMRLPPLAYAPMYRTLGASPGGGFPVRITARCRHESAVASLRVHPTQTM